MLKLSSNEAISFQPKSKFAKELVEIFEKGMVFREKLKEKYDSHLIVVREFHNFFISIMAVDLINCIQKHTGIPVSKLFISRSFSSNFACSVFFGNDKGINFYTTIQKYSGIELDEFEKEYVMHNRNKVISEKDIEKLAANFNIDTGKMSISKLADKDISFVLYFDYNAAFLVKETAHVKCEYMTAEEIAGIVLHEVGHMMTMFEHAADAYFKAVYYNNNFINNFVKKSDKYELIEYGLNFLEDKFPNKKHNIDALRAKVDTYKKDAKESGLVSTPVFVSLLYIAIMTMLILVCNLVFLPVNILMKILNPMMETLENTNKLSDYAHLRKQYKYCEQLADEFVSRHGLSRGLSTGLQKIFDWCSVTGLSLVNSNSGLIWAAGKIPFFILTLFYGDLTDGGGLYDREYDRITRAMNNILTVFKNEGMPKDAIDYFINDYEQCKESIEQYRRNNKFTEVMHTIHKMFDYILSTPIDVIFTGRFLSEYNKLHNAAEQLIVNSMSYHATKLRQILRNAGKNK